MRIIHVYDGHEKVCVEEGGSPASIAYELARYAVKKGHQVTVLERKWKGLPHEEEKEGIKFVRINPRVGSNIPYKENPYMEIKRLSGTLRLILDRSIFAFEASRYIRRNDFDVIHVHLPFAACILIMLNRKLANKMIYTAHVGEEKKRFALDPSVTPLALRFFSPDLYLVKRVRKSVVLNEPLKQKLVEKGIKKEKLEVIPNGVNVEEFNLGKEEVTKIRRKYQLDEDKVIVMFTGGVKPRKGVEYLIKAAHILKNNLKNNNVLFLIVGPTDRDIQYAEAIMRYAKEKGIYAKFTGFIPWEDLKALYSACDIFVLPSLEEGHGLVLTEAMASGKPLIGSNVGGIPKQIRDGWNGFLVKPGNEKQLAEKIRYLIDNPKERERMGGNSRKLAEEEFDWKKIAERYLKVYEEVAE